MDRHESERRHREEASGTCMRRQKKSPTALRAKACGVSQVTRRKRGVANGCGRYDGETYTQGTRDQ